MHEEVKHLKTMQNVSLIDIDLLSLSKLDKNRLKRSKRSVHFHTIFFTLFKQVFMATLNE